MLRLSRLAETPCRGGSLRAGRKEISFEGRIIARPSYYAFHAPSEAYRRLFCRLVFHPPPKRKLHRSQSQLATLSSQSQKRQGFPTACRARSEGTSKGCLSNKTALAMIFKFAQGRREKLALPSPVAED